ncbi:MAG: HAD family hydrolase [Candidatus Omnitrophota bacterium]
MAAEQNIIALIYDFDKTLSPNNMQEDTIFPAYGIDKDRFWEKAMALVREKGYERTIAYLRLLVQGKPFAAKPLRRTELRALGKKVRYYPGVETFFGRMDRYIRHAPAAVTRWGIRLEHYIVSSGMKEILEGTKIAKYFKAIYACELDYEAGCAVFPKLIINDTNKTQFLFRINKGKLSLAEDINSHMPAEERRIPFENMIYLGDSETDVPSMTVMQKNGGHVIAVFDPAFEAPPEARALVQHGRANHFAPADYTEDSLLDRILKNTLDKILHTIAYRCSARMSKDWVRRKKESR